jgi:hypothetical protein
MREIPDFEKRPSEGNDNTGLSGSSERKRKREEGTTSGFGSGPAGRHHLRFTGTAAIRLNLDTESLYEDIEQRQQHEARDQRRKDVIDTSSDSYNESSHERIHHQVATSRQDGTFDLNDMSREQLREIAQGYADKECHSAHPMRDEINKHPFTASECRVIISEFNAIIKDIKHLIPEKKIKSIKGAIYGHTVERQKYQKSSEYRVIMALASRRYYDRKKGKASALHLGLTWQGLDRGSQA